MSSINEDNFGSRIGEIRALTDHHGPDIYHYFLRRLVANNIPTFQSNGSAPNTVAWRLMSLEGKRVARDLVLASHFATAVDQAPDSDLSRTLSLTTFVARLNLTAGERLTFGAGIVSSRSTRLIDSARQIISESITDALDILRSGATGFFEQETDISPGMGTLLLSTLLTNLQPALLEPSQRSSLLNALSMKFGPMFIASSVGSLPLPLLATTLHAFILELGRDLLDSGALRMVIQRWWASAEESTLQDRVQTLIHGIVNSLAEATEPRGIDGPALIRAIINLDPNGSINWSALVQRFDSALSSPLGLLSPSIFSIFTSILTLPSQSAHPPISGLLAPSTASTPLWSTNPAAQLMLVNALLALPPDTFNLASLPSLTKILTNKDINDAPGIITDSPWNALEIFELCAKAAREDVGEDVNEHSKEIIENGMKNRIELVFLGLVMNPKPWPAPHADLISRLLDMFFAHYLTNMIVFTRLWQVEADLLLEYFARVYSSSEINVTGIVDVAQHVKALDAVLAQRPFEMALDVACVAFKSDMAELESWLGEVDSTEGNEFRTALFKFTLHKVTSELGRQAQDGEAHTLAVSPQTLIALLHQLDRSPQEDTSNLDELRILSLQLYPRLMNLLPFRPHAHAETVATFSEDIEAEVDDIYHQMYHDAESIPVETVLNHLVAWKASADEQRQQIFACMLYTLLDEYKFFHTYPPRELSLTGQLFGSLIQRKLVEGIPLMVAVRFVIDGLKSVPESPTSNFTFGITALQAFQSRLHEFPEVCEAILGIQNLHDSHPHLIEFVRTTMADRENGLSRGDEARVEVDSPPPTFKALNLDSFDVDHEPIEEPDEDTSDRILFIVNNLAPSNFDAKVGDMKHAFEPRHARWFANYFISTRVSVEPNNHTLYMQFLHALDRSLLDKHVLYETYAKAHGLLNSEKTVTQAQDRSTLKNLGSWLGRLTLARNKPIRFKHLSLKDLLIEGFEAKRLIVAIPFVCKILEHCNESSIFRPPNPWLMAVIRLLVELYQTAELKLNLKFEIEVLCKTLGVDLASIVPTTIIRDRPTQLADVPPPVPPGGSLAQDLERLSMGPGGYAGGTDGSQRMSSVQLYQTEAAAQAAQAALNRKVDELIAELPSYLAFPPETLPFSTNATLKRIVYTAIERAVREIVVPVVERSVTIAGISSRDLITKDFAMEPDESKMRKAAHSMVQNLAGNLAMVTSKEPLRTSITTSIRALLQQNGFNESAIPSESVVAAVTCNLDLAASVIKKAAQDKAVYDVDETLTPAFALRRKHREQRANQPFWDGTQTAVNIGMLPEMLRIRPNGLLPQQLDVYEEFGRPQSPSSIPRLSNIVDGKVQRAGIIDRGGRSVSGGRSAYRTPSPSKDVLAESAGGLSNAEQAVAKFNLLLVELDKFFGQSTVPALAALPPTHDVKQAIQQIPLVAAQSVNRDETALSFSQKVVQLLFKTDSLLGREVYVAILQRLCEAFPKVHKEVSTWLIYAEDERKFNVPVTVALLRAGLINVVEQDVQLASFILRDLRTSVVEFTVEFLRECLLGEKPCASRSQFSHCIEALGRAAQAGKASETTVRLLEEIAGNLQPTGQQADDGGLRDRLAFYFLEWVRMFQHAPSAEQAFVGIVTNLQAQGILKGDDATFLFFRVCAEVSVEGYAKLKVTDPAAALIPMDALSKIITLLLKNYGDPNGTEVDESRIRYLNKILSIVVLVLVQSHEELQNEFDQRPFFRFFSSILNDLYSIEPSIHTAAYMGCLQAFSSNTLNMLQPTLLPGFAFSWMSLISHRHFMPKLLQGSKEKCWSEYHNLLLAMFKFLAPFLSSPKMQEASRVFYKGAMRIILVILHDFPEFLAEYYHSLLDVLPLNCVQIRNVIIAAFPRKHALPNPFLYDFAEGDAEKHSVPVILSDYFIILQSRDLRVALEDCVYSDRSIPALVPALKARIATPAANADAPETVYNLPFLNAVVLFTGSSAVSVTTNTEGLANFEFDSALPIAKLHELLAAELDAEGKYHLISSITTHLRYPNAHTWFFSHLLVHLFNCPAHPTSSTGLALSGDNAKLPEIIARVLLERVVATRPHPWGLLVTFIQMLKLPTFWSHEFVTRSPELAALFKTCSL